MTQHHHRRSRRIGSALVAASLLAMLIGAMRAPSTQPFQPVPDQKHLENAHVIDDRLISGAQPEGDESFRLLQQMGVKTIISVDGATPDLERAKKFGLRYVHLPIGYDGVTEERGREIAKAITDLPGPIYLHCHHGKHRSAAAVAVACVYAGILPPERAEDVLKTFGTGKNYSGLWKAARDARPLSPEVLGAVKVDYVESAKIGETAIAMVAIDMRWDHLKLLQSNKWQPHADHPDLDPPHEALQLEELFREIARSDHAHTQVPAFNELLAGSEAQSRKLRAALSAKPVDTETANAAFTSIQTSCATCHKAYRD